MRGEEPYTGGGDDETEKIDGGREIGDCYGGS
jgi:hypothetical protein